jgi:pimeloyl-ACP methyl ester carboxylesterase
MNSQNKIYCISGLGADERVFGFLRLPGAEMVQIKWVMPGQNESISNYARRLVEQMDTREAITLMGVSFGGIIAQEIAKLIPCRQVIILSSVKSRAEMPRLIALVRLTHMHRLVSGRLLKWGGAAVASYYFSVKTREENRLLQSIIRHTDPAFLRWAVDQVVHWQNRTAITGLVHIHGTKDRIFPIGRIRDAVKVDGGGHFMIVNKADLITKLIREQIQE